MLLPPLLISPRVNDTLDHGESESIHSIGEQPSRDE